ncbi:MAG: YraN family protein [Anaerolineae bacterium]|nr:YraN family protein [Anaerolineae bacterium]
MPTNTTRRLLGQQGEAVVTRHLLDLGWQLVERNWRCRTGEIDLIMQDDKTLVIVEVRTRRGKVAMENALASVNARKQAKLMELAATYRFEKNIDDATPIRVDVVGVALATDGTFAIKVIQDALSW